MYRVCTDFWIPKPTLFSDLFQNNDLVFQTQGYHVGDLERLKKKTQAQSFFHDALQTYGQNEKNNSHIKHLL